MKHGFFALESGEWVEFQKTFRNVVKVTEWACDRIKEAFEMVAKDGARKLSTVQEIMIRSAGYLRRIIAPTGEQGGVTMMSCLCPHCSRFPMEDYDWWVSGEKKHANWWCAICGEKYDWKQSMLLVVQTGGSVNQANGLQSACSTSGLVRESD